jgi:hypothetical protein
MNFAQSMFGTTDRVDIAVGGGDGQSGLGGGVMSQSNGCFSEGKM